MMIKILFIFNLLILLIMCHVTQAVEDDLIVAETAVAKKALTGVSAMKAGQKKAVVSGGKKLAKGAAVGKAFGVAKAGIKAKKVGALALVKKGGLKKGLVAKSGLKKLRAKKLGFNNAFLAGSKSSFGKVASFGKKSNFALKKSNGILKSVDALKKGMKKKAGLVGGISTGVKKVSKAGKVAFATGKGAKIGGMVSKAGAVGLKKGAMVSGGVSKAKKVIAAKAVKG